MSLLDASEDAPYAWKTIGWGSITADDIAVGSITATTIGGNTIANSGLLSIPDSLTFPEVSVRRGGANYNVALQNPITVSWTGNLTPQVYRILTGLPMEETLL